MHLVALVSDDADLNHALRSFRDSADRFHLHPVPTGNMADLLRALVRLDFAGALVLGHAAQGEVQRLAERSSLDAQELSAADTLPVTPAGIVADHTFGRAVGAMLLSRRWDAAGANAVILGVSPEAKAVARSWYASGWALHPARRRPRDRRAGVARGGARSGRRARSIRWPLRSSNEPTCSCA